MIGYRTRIAQVLTIATVLLMMFTPVPRIRGGHIVLILNALAVIFLHEAVVRSHKNTITVLREAIERMENRQDHVHVEMLHQARAIREVAETVKPGSSILGKTTIAGREAL